MKWNNVKPKNNSFNQNSTNQNNYKNISKDIDSDVNQRVIIVNRDSDDDDAAKAVERMMEATFDSNRHKLRRNEFRVSSFPYCPVLDFFNYTEDDYEYSDYGTDFYMGAGTAIHENIQYYKPISQYGDHVIGAWKCNSCGKIWGYNYPGKKPSYKEQKKWCSKGKKCSGELIYEEIDFKYHNLSGHLDNLTQLPLKNQPVCAWEYKTCGNKYVDDPYYRKFLPFDKHPHQIETYCALLWLVYGIRVHYYAIVYIARDKPFYNDRLHCAVILRSVTDKKLNWRIKWLKQSIRARKAVESFESGNEKAVNNIVRYKPCQRPNDYLENGMDDRFFGREKCPFYQSGTCFQTDKLKKELLNRLNNWQNRNSSKSKRKPKKNKNNSKSNRTHNRSNKTKKDKSTR